VAAALALIRERGFEAATMREIASRAGVSTGNAYYYFGSKEELIRAYLEERHVGTLRALGEAVARHSDPRARLLAVFDAQAELFAQPGFRGCAFASACAEAPAGGLIQEAATSYREEIRELLVALSEAAGARDPAIATAARAAAASLVDA